jgi:hypothetical protein
MKTGKLPACEKQNHNMTNTFRKHHKTFMWVIIVGTIFSFVWFLSPTARNGGGGGSSGPAVSYGSINGEPVTPVQFAAAVREARLVFRLSQRRWPTRDQEDILRQIAYQRLFIEAKLKELNLVTTDEEAARFTRQMLGVPEGQAFPKDKFAEFISKELNQGGGITLEDFNHYVRIQVGQALLVELYGMNGQLITQKEGEFFYRRENENMNVELARFEASNYVDKITFTPQDVENFFTNRQSDYRLPEREQVNYILFETSNYLAAANLQMSAMSNLDVSIDQAYSSSDPALFKDASGAPLSEAAAKEKIRKEFLPLSIARHAAQTNAVELTTRLADGHDKTHPINMADFKQLAETNGLKLVTPPPFDEKNPPKEWQLPAQALNVVFQGMDLGDPDDQFKLIQGSNGFYLIGLQQKFPSQSRTFAEVRGKVTEDYRTFKALDMAKEAGTRFADLAKQKLAAGVSFDAVCLSQQVKPEVLSPFSSVTPSIPEIEDRDEFSFVTRVVYDLPAGQPSVFAPTESGGFVGFVKSRTPVDDTIVQRDMPAFLARFRTDRQTAAFNQWLQREMHLHVVMADSAKTGPLS